MNVLSALVRAYSSLSDAPTYGYSIENFDYAIPIAATGAPLAPIDLRTGEKSRLRPARIAVPQPAKRSSNIAPNFLWDKTSYALGVDAANEANTPRQHDAFIKFHLTALAGTNDPGLAAFRLFLGAWRPSRFAELNWPEDMKGRNVIFFYDNAPLHERAAATTFWERHLAGNQRDAAICLVTGEKAPIARIHPSIKRIAGAKSSGASLVSFNQDAFTSNGKLQGDNAPMSEAATFAYAAALNRLARDNGHHIQLADTTIVFWAEAPDQDTAHAVESFFTGLIGSTKATKKAAKAAFFNADDLQKRNLSDVRFTLIGLAPNITRLSVRFFADGPFSPMFANIMAHFQRMNAAPYPTISSCLLETALRRDETHISPVLAGELMRAILANAPYPATLLIHLIMRIHADKIVNPLRVRLLAAALSTSSKEPPMSLDIANTDTAYLLGRLFAVYEFAHQKAVSAKLSIREQHYALASSSPRTTFARLQRNAMQHLSRLRKTNPGLCHNLDRDLRSIFDLAGPETLFPLSLSNARQALFAIGYFHQRNSYFPVREILEPDLDEITASAVN